MTHILANITERPGPFAAWAGLALTALLAAVFLAGRLSAGAARRTAEQRDMATDAWLAASRRCRLMQQQIDQMRADTAPLDLGDGDRPSPRRRTAVRLSKVDPAETANLSALTRVLSPNGGRDA